MKYKNLKLTILLSILLGLASCNGEDDSKSETLDPSEEKVLSIDQIKDSQEEFLVEEIDTPDEKEPEESEEPELNKDEIEAEAETKDEIEDDDDEEVVEDDDEEVQ
ncbi:hypothetical protein [Candidatus Marithrix sp. Canyon 246]|uniref:hypothetical protein n=1 Tax=Candidatus Marithrix sp. Canyon 246 TaxID=1827136 RepID=UPI00084A204F|nr:hypothetical protein [Candidatus Marithrix sp. Canyon 246]